jgi:hypothetical protein
MNQRRTTGNYLWRTCTPAGPWIGVVLYVYDHCEHMVHYDLNKVRVKQEQWDDHWRYQPTKEGS